MGGVKKVAMNYQGVIIEESLKDKSILKELKVLKIDVEKVTKEHNTPYLKQWTLYTVEIPEDKVQEFSKKISQAFERAHSDWYADYKNNKFHYIIFPHKVFKVSLKNPRKYKEASAYGISLGIPSYQVNFYPENNEE